MKIAPSCHASLLALLVAALSALPASAQTCCAPPGADVVAWWPLDETQGTTAADHTGQHDGSHVGQPAPMPGQVQGALQFDGVDDYVSVGDSTAWALTGNFTIELWVKWDAAIGASNPSDAFVAQSEGGGNQSKWFFWAVQDPPFSTVSGPALVFHINYPTSPNGGNGVWPAASFDPEVDRWYHVAVVRQGTTYSFYADGALLASEPEASVILDASAVLTIGQAEGGNHMDGWLDEVTIYSRALMPTEIQAIHASGAFGKCGGVEDCNANGVLDEIDVCLGTSPDVNANGVPDECETITYCTSGTSASGCNAIISATGIPSATASSGFTLDATNVEGAKGGMFFYGFNGRQANPWGSSFQCVVPPVKRGGLFPPPPGSTVGACDGTFALDLNARWCPTCPKPFHNPGAGAVVQAQLWYRDPQNMSNTTSMSDAIEFTVGL